MRNLTEDVFEFLRDIQDEVGKETRAKVGKSIYTWSDHYSNWINIIESILRSTSKEEQLNSMVVPRLIELNNQLFWILTNVIYNAAYHQVIRELRFILDSMMQAFYLDMQHPEADIYCKLEIVKEIEKEAFGTRLIERLPLQHKDGIKQLYSLLSKYSHSSYEELESLILTGKVWVRVTPTFDGELFAQCQNLTHKVMDVVYFVVLNRFPQLCPVIKQNRVVMEILEKFGADLTLDYLQSAHHSMLSKRDFKINQEIL